VLVRPLYLDSEIGLTVFTLRRIERQVRSSHISLCRSLRAAAIAPLTGGCLEVHWTCALGKATFRDPRRRALRHDLLDPGRNVITQLKPIDNRRLYQQIADQIRALIKDGGFAVGSRLPPERDLAQQLGVSRPSVREALIALEIDGSVEVRMGAGVYVCAASEHSAQSTTSMGESPLELMQARSALEGSVVALACGLSTPEGIATVSKALEEMRAAIEEKRSPLKEDRAFHLAIAAMTGNSVMERLVRELFDERHSPIASQLRVRSESSETWLEALREHEAILRALESRDVIAAQTTMRSHLQASQDRWVASRREWS